MAANFISMNARFGFQGSSNKPQAKPTQQPNIKWWPLISLLSDPLPVAITLQLISE